MARKKRYRYDEEREYNPYFTELDEYFESDGEEVEEGYLSKEDLEYREGETAAQRRRRLKIAKEANKQKRKQKVTRKRSSVLNLTVFRVLRIFMTVCASGFLFFTIVLSVYDREVRFPSQEVVDETQTGYYCLSNWAEALGNLDGGISEFIGSDVSYLETEINYANSNEIRTEFFKRMISTIKYIPDEVVAKNKYGNPMIDSTTGLEVMIPSYIEEGEEVTMEIVDYDSIVIDENLVKQMMSEEGIKLGDAGYSASLTNLFCRYMVEMDELPIKEIRRVPNMFWNENGYSISEEEDIYLDRLLFSSDEFHNLLTRFSEAAGKNSENPKWKAWNLSPNKANTQEPAKVFDVLPVTQEWYKWYMNENKTNIPEPGKYNSDYVIGDTWCGAYYLQNEYVELDAEGNEVYRVVEPALGDGSFENPASLNTEVVSQVSYSYKDANGKTVTETCPIGVTMVEYGVSQDALDWFDSKDERNRGHDIKSEVQYVYYVFKIRNLSSRTLTITDNSSLCDANVNFSERTGIIYGLKDSVTLSPGQEGYIESWSASTELNKKYIVWGRSFSRQADVVWFRKLAGDLEDTSNNKGVTLNTSRFGEDESES